MWGQVATSLVKQDNLSVTLACKLFDHHRQSFYQLKSDIVFITIEQPKLIRNIRV